LHRGAQASLLARREAAIIPIKTYSNAEIEKKKILSENKNKSGIYSWKNLINDKHYIGSAIDLSNRLEKYYSIAYMEDVLNRSNSHIYRAILKNGHSNFSLEILEYCSPDKCLFSPFRASGYSLRPVQIFIYLL
jgi:hypothetical protein